MYTHVIASTGWTWDYIAEHMDIPRIEALNRYWAQYPPMHILLAAHVGWRAPDAAAMPADAQQEQEQDFIPPQHLAPADFEQLLRDKGLTQDGMP